MEMNEEIPFSPTNRHSIVSLIFGVITVITFCGGIIIPIPFTGFICIPASFLLGLLALTYGAISLNKIKSQNESGRPMAWIGILSGGFIFLCILCAATTLISLFTLAPDSFHLPPFLENYKFK